MIFAKWKSFFAKSPLLGLSQRLIRGPGIAGEVASFVGSLISQ
jgi:hypothetical protein